MGGIVCATKDILDLHVNTVSSYMKLRTISSVTEMPNLLHAELLVGCGPNMTDPCSSNGICLSMKQLAAYNVDSFGNSSPLQYGNVPNNPGTWDADRIHGCFCDDGYSGYDCSLRSCPLGDDPNTEDNDTLEVCSNHGICDYVIGECKCLPGWGSSDGSGGLGSKRDCGHRLPVSVLPRKGIQIIKKYHYKPWFPS